MTALAKSSFSGSGCSLASVPCPLFRASLPRVRKQTISPPCEGSVGEMGVSGGGLPVPGPAPPARVPRRYRKRRAVSQEPFEFSRSGSQNASRLSGKPWIKDTIRTPAAAHHGLTSGPPCRRSRPGRGTAPVAQVVPGIAKRTPCDGHFPLERGRKANAGNRTDRGHRAAPV